MNWHQQSKFFVAGAWIDYRKVRRNVNYSITDIDMRFVGEIHENIFQRDLSCGNG